MESFPTELVEANVVSKRCLQVRITKCYNDLSGVLESWKEKCEELLVVEHPADDKVSRTHCHILLVNQTVKNDQLQKPLRAMNLNGQKGDFMFSFVVIKGKFKGEPYKRDETAIYFIKGRYEVKMSKGFAADELEQFKSEWTSIAAKASNEVIPPKSNDSEWDYFLTKYDKSGQDLTMTGIKRWIRADCLSRRKPIPRAGDVNRWAFSIYAIMNNRTKVGDQEDLEEVANNQTVKID